jgi:hypothetical protein
MKTGWGITLLGWILLTLIVGVALYSAVTWFTRPPKENQ